MEISLGRKRLATGRQSLFQNKIEVRQTLNRQSYLSASHEKLEQIRLRSKKRKSKGSD